MTNEYPSARPVPRRRVAVTFKKPSLTVQSEKDNCDINRILDKYTKTGMLEHVNRYKASYGDCPSADFREALEVVRNGEAMFKALPSKVRSRFDHDPAAFLKFLEDPANLEEARLLGLAHPDTTQKDLKVPSESSSDKP